MTSAPNDLYPKPPAGYQPAALFQYPTAKLQTAALIVFVLAIPPLLALTQALQCQLGGKSLVGLQGAQDLAMALATVLATTVVHELVHGGVYRWLGYRVCFGVSRHLLAAYAAVFGQWQTRDHNVIAALGPIVGLTAILFPALCVANQTVALLGLIGLLMNISGSVGDVYLVWRLLNMPRRTLLYDVDVKTMLVYAPVEPG